MNGVPKKNLLGAVVILLLFGLVRLPLERGIEERLSEKGFIEEEIELSMLVKLRQEGFAAALGGYRPLVANIYYLMAHMSAFEKKDWGQVDQKFGLITTLQPRSGHYWDQYVWHLGWNAYAWAQNEADYQELQGNHYKAWTLRNITAPGFLDRAEEIAIKGATVIKDDYRFYQRVGLFYEDKKHDVCEAARWFEIGSKIEGAPRFMGNIYAIFLSRCEGKEDEAYPLIRARYWDRDVRRRGLTVMIQMEALEDRLAQRELDEKGIEEVQRLAKSEPENYLHAVAAAKYYNEVEGLPEKAMRVYQKMMAEGGEKIPEFYKLKWALLAAGDPEREKLAYDLMRQILPQIRRRLSAEEEAVVRPLEERLKIPEEQRLFPPKKSKKPL